MYDKFQIYSLYKRLKKIWGMKRFNTSTVRDLLETNTEDLLIAEFISDNNHVQYMSNYAINLANEFRCGVMTIQTWAMEVLAKALIEGKFPELKDCNRASCLQKFAIFNNRNEIIEQTNFINNLVKEKNSGLNEFSDKHFTLFGLDNEYKNNAYYLCQEHKISPVFFIKGLEAKKFEVDIQKVKDIEYKRFITVSKLILKFKNEVNNAN